MPKLLRIHVPSLRKTLHSNRRFHGAVAALFLLLAGLFFYAQWESHLRFMSLTVGVTDFQRRDACRQASWQMLDYAWETFADHVRAINEIPVHNASDRAMRKILNSWRTFPVCAGPTV